MAEWDQDTIVEDSVNHDAIVSKIDAPDVKLFGKWSLNDVEVSDISLGVSFFLIMHFSLIYLK